MFAKVQLLDTPVGGTKVTLLLPMSFRGRSCGAPCGAVCLYLRMYGVSCRCEQCAGSIPAKPGRKGRAPSREASTSRVPVERERIYTGNKS